MKRRLLLNMKLLASELGVSPVFIKRMKYAGFEMPGGVATVEWALDWLRKHPDFRQKDHLRPPRELPKMTNICGLQTGIDVMYRIRSMPHVSLRQLPGIVCSGKPRDYGHSRRMKTQMLHLQFGEPLVPLFAAYCGSSTKVFLFSANALFTSGTRSLCRGAV